MIILLHGDHIEASRNELNRLKHAAKGKEVRMLDGRTLDATSLAQAIGSRSLFGGDVLIVIECLGKKPLRIPESKETDIIIWEDKEVSATAIKSLGPSVQVKLFAFPKLLFQFLDNLRLPLYQQLIQTEAPELVFTMIARRVRQLIMVKDGAAPEGMKDWQIGKLTSQSRSFTMDILVAMEKKLLDIEYSLKTGATPFSMQELTEQFLIDL